jgi:osmotically-inducible protein OsmY
VYGVTSVDNKLQVRLLNDQGRSDAELRGDVLQALMLDSLIPTTVNATVADGLVTLTGTVDWQYQRDEADFVASNIAGALDVLYEIEISHPTPTAGDTKESIKKAFKRNAAVDADDLDVSTDNGTVTIEGTVSPWAEHDEAIDAAWAAPGVTSVRDDMTIAYWQPQLQADHLVKIGTGGARRQPSPDTYVAGIEFLTDVKRRWVV